MIIQLNNSITESQQSNLLAKLSANKFSINEVNTQLEKYLVCIGKNEIDIREIGHLPGIKDVHIGVKNKKVSLIKLLNDHNFSLDQVLYMGDDMPDLEVMQQCGVPTCPNDAIQQISNICVYISDKKGGDGCVRDVIEQVLTLHGKWQ